MKTHTHFEPNKCIYNEYIYQYVYMHTMFVSICIRICICTRICIYWYTTKYMVYAHIIYKNNNNKCLITIIFFFSKFVLIKLYNKYLNIPRKIEFVFKLFYYFISLPFSLFQFWILHGTGKLCSIFYTCRSIYRSLYTVVGTWVVHDWVIELYIGLDQFQFQYRFRFHFLFRLQFNLSLLSFSVILCMNHTALFIA